MSNCSQLIQTHFFINDNECINGINGDFNRYYSNKSKNIHHYSIQINGSKREYVIMNMQINITNVLLCFPGGGEDLNEFILYTQFDKIKTPIIVFLGQPSKNTYSFQNSFPWLYKFEYQNDVSFVDTVINKHCVNVKHIYLTGKSDGAGFTILYANLSIYKKYIKAIGICSDAHFGLNSKDNIGIYSSFNSFKGKNGIIIPYNIILPPQNVSLFIMHGTRDTIMPYYGNHYINSKAIMSREKTLWKTIDPSVNGPPEHSKSISNTYNPNINEYVEKMKTTYQFKKINIIDDPKYSLYSYNNKKNNVINFITINGQNHCWSGHYNSGPDSNKSENFYLDATYLLILFFELDIGNYIPTVDTIPHGFINYQNKLVDT